MDNTTQPQHEPSVEEDVQDQTIKPTKDTSSTLETVHRLTIEAAETREKTKDIREQLSDVLDQNDEYRELSEQIKELTKKRSVVKAQLAEDKDYQSLTADLDDFRLKLKDINEILSQHLVLYYDQTQQTKIVDRDGETRSVILSAKLGRAEA